MINKALEVNPNYLNGLKYKAELKAKQGKSLEALEAVNHALGVLGPPDWLTSEMFVIAHEFSNEKSRLEEIIRTKHLQ